MIFGALYTKMLMLMKALTRLAKTKTSYITAFGIVSILLLGNLYIAPSDSVNANRGDQLEAEIQQLERQISSNEEQAEHYHQMAENLEDAIADLNKDINQAQKKIDLTNLKIKNTTKKLDETRNELDRQKAILAKSLREHYKIGDVSTIELFASAENFSEFFNQKEYLDRVRSSIQESSKEVARLEKQLEDQKEELEDLRDEQVAQRKQLDAKKDKKQQLLKETRGQQARYEAYASRLAQKQDELEEERLEWLRSQQGSFVAYGQVNAGDIIGYTGTTGNSTGPHLHMSILTPGANYVNPIANEGGSCSEGAPATNCQLIRGYSWPYANKDFYFTSNYGYRWGRLHSGIDIASNWGAGYNINGAPIRAIADGTIIKCNGQCYQAGGAGYYITIKHNDGYISQYMHMQPN